MHEALWHPVYGYSNLQSYQIAKLPDNFIMLHHYPDRTKPRANYLDLLKMRFAEYPAELYTITYLAHEFSYQHLWQEGVDFINNVAIPYYQENQQKIPIVFYTSIYRFLGNNYVQLGDLDKAADAYQKGIEVDKTYRENYLQLAKVLFKKQKYLEAIDLVNQSFIHSRKRNS